MGTWMVVGSAEDPIPGVKKQYGGWKSSDGHRENMENPQFTHASVGVHFSEEKGYIATMLFANEVDFIDLEGSGDYTDELWMKVIQTQVAAEQQPQDRSALESG